MAKKKKKKPTQKTTRKTTKKTTKKAAKKAAPKKTATKKATKKVTAKKTATKKSSTSKVAKKVASSSLSVGSVVPSFTLKDSMGQEFDLSSHQGRKIILYFYPKDDTPGCTLEGQQFNHLLNDFKNANAEIYGVSRDTSESHDKFKCKYGFQFELLADTEEKVCQLFDVIKEKNMYGKMVMGIERSTFIIDEQGRLAYEERGVKADGHAALMLEKIKNM